MTPLRIMNAHFQGTIFNLAVFAIQIAVCAARVRSGMEKSNIAAETDGVSVVDGGRAVEHQIFVGKAERPRTTNNS